MCLTLPDTFMFTKLCLLFCWECLGLGFQLLLLLRLEDGSIINQYWWCDILFCRKDSTGIPHILEHSVLCGSRKYPLKEPFVELLKGSLHTFLNAFTYPDRTCYPVASTNLQVSTISAHFFSAFLISFCVEEIVHYLPSFSACLILK